jgi:two-component system cell cycle response regulator
MKKKTILIVEDDPLNMKLFHSILSMEGFELIQAYEAEQGMKLAKTNRPDLILMDIQLPGMNGLEATRIIKNDPQLQHTPVVALTAHAMEGDDQKAYEAGCNGYITKPIDVRTFADTVRSKLGSNQQELSTIIPDLPSTEYKEIRGHDRYRKSILIVDDEPLNRKLLSGMLESENYHLMTSEDGESALDIINQQLPDIILLDIMMPGMDGYEVTRKLKSCPDTCSIPIILITALSAYDDKIKGLEAGADEFLNKPVQAEELITRVQSLLRMKEYHERLTSKVVTEKNFTHQPQSDTPPANQREKQVVLVVEDSPEYRRLVQAHLQGEPYRLLMASSGKEAVALIEQEAVDCLLLDIMLPDMDGFAICEKLQNNEAYRHIQTVGITSAEDLSLKIKGIEAGFDDYLIKPVNFTELKVRIKALLRKKAYLDQLQDKYQAGFQQAISDQLTGLYNNSYFKHFLGVDIQKADRRGYPISLIMADVDNFKLVNDEHGHITGDLVLKEIASTLKNTIRITDVAARYGGEEFALILPYTDPDSAMVLADRILEAVRSSPFAADAVEQGLPITISLGIATYPYHASSATKLLERADQSLYKAKKQGKDCWTIFQPADGFSQSGKEIS